MSYKFCILLSLLCLHQAESCPDEAGWIAVGNSSCYLASLDNFGWEYAQQFCWDQGGYLAEITSAEEESALDEILGHITTYWIGLSDRETEGSYIWSESGQEADYTNWAEGQPDDAHAPAEDCIFKSKDAEHLGWSDSDCGRVSVWGDPIHALCEIDI